MTDNETRQRLDRIEKVLFGRTWKQELEFKRTHSISDEKMRRVWDKLLKLDPEAPRFDAHVMSVKVNEGLDMGQFSHCVNLLKAMAEGRSVTLPDYVEKIKQFREFVRKQILS